MMVKMQLLKVNNNTPNHYIGIVMPSASCGIHTDIREGNDFHFQQFWHTVPTAQRYSSIATKGIRFLLGS